MLPSDMTLKIRPGTVGYNNKILVSDEKFILGKNEKVNLTVPVMKSHKTNSLETPAIKTHKQLPGQSTTQIMCYHMHQLFLRKIRNLRQ